jgi:hypothetical protein
MALTTKLSIHLGLLDWMFDLLFYFFKFLYFPLKEVIFFYYDTKTTSIIFLELCILGAQKE